MGGHRVGVTGWGVTGLCAAYGASIMAWNCSSRVADADGGVVDVAGVAGAVGASDAIVAAWGWRGAGAGLARG